MIYRFVIAQGGALTDGGADLHKSGAIELSPEALGGIIRGLADIATNTWKARERMVDQDGEPKEELKRTFRHIDAIQRRLQAMDIRVVAHDREVFDYGLPLKVVATQPTLGLARDTIIETLKPTIYWRGEMIQMGEVIVGTPRDASQGEA